MPHTQAVMSLMVILFSNQIKTTAHCSVEWLRLLLGLSPGMDEQNIFQFYGEVKIGRTVSGWLSG